MVHETSLYDENCFSLTRHKRFPQANKDQLSFILEPQFTALRPPSNLHLNLLFILICHYWGLGIDLLVDMPFDSVNCD
jgi:hypothetical protein